MIKIHGTSYNSALRAALITAQKSIFITSYVCVLNRKKKNCPVNILFEIILRKLASGLDIRWIIDRPRRHKTNYHAGKHMVRRFKKNRVPFWIAPAQNTLHAKIVIIDGKLLFLGSHNLAKSSFINRLEVSIETADPTTCNSMIDWFLGCCQDPAFSFFPPGSYYISDLYP